MGRLQRKKTTHTKKKKEPGDDVASLSGASGAAIKKAVQITASAKDAKKIKNSFFNKSSKETKRIPRKQKIKYLDSGLQFLREVKVELKKVTWPSRKQTVNSTVVVIILVMLISFFLGAVDIGLSSLISIIL